MQYVQFKKDAKFDLIAMGRIAIDFNPIDYFKTLAESKEYRKYLGGSPANVAVGLARLGKKVGFVARVSDDRFGDYVTDFFAKEGIDVSHVKRAEHGEKLGLTFTEILSPTESSILMYRDGIADLSLDPSDVDEEYIASAKALLISGTALAQSPSREACLKAMQFAEKNDARIIFDIDYRPYNWKSADEIAVYYTAVAEHADIIMGSREEFDLTERLIEAVTGKKTNLFAPPSGAFSADTLTAADHLGYRIIMWSRDTIDWRDKDPDLVLTRCTRDIKNGELILMHPTEHTLKALPAVLASLKEQGFSAVTVSENLEESPQPGGAV